MPQGLRITVPIGTNEGIITNVFVRITNIRIYPTSQPADMNVYAWSSLTAFQQQLPSLVIKALPSVIAFPSLPISAFNNVANVEDFVYQVLEAAIEAVTGIGSVIVVP